MTLPRLRSWLARSIVAAVLLAPGAAAAQSQLTVVIGYPPGAIYDAYGRLVAKHLGKHLPGNPTVVVQNMPGAGSLRATNYLYALAPKDGATIGLSARGMAMQPLLDAQGIQFDAQKFSWIGSPSSEVSVVVAAAAAPFKTIEDARQREMVLSASGSGADSVIFPSVLNGVIGTRFKLISGYPGNADMLLAVERGEVDGNAGTSWTTLVALKPDWLREKKVNVLLQMANKKHPDLAQVPMALDFARTEEDRKVLDLIFSRQEMAYPFAAPPGVALERVAALRAAFAATMKDPAFLADAKRQSFDIDPVSGEQVAAIIGRVYASPADVIARARAIVEHAKASTPK
jgi:tripartite-type tricarboxylate transporter receptor subunit TctC